MAQSAPVLPPEPVQPDASLLFQNGYESALKGITSSKLFKDNPKSVDGLISELSQSKKKFDSRYSEYSRDNGAWALEQSGLQPTIAKIEQQLPVLDAAYRSSKSEGQAALLKDALKGNKKFSVIAEEDPSLLNTPGIASFVRQGINREESDDKKLSRSQKVRAAGLAEQLKKAYAEENAKDIAAITSELDNLGDSQPSTSLLDPVPVFGPSASVQNDAPIPENALTAPLNPAINPSLTQGVPTAWGAAMGQPQNQPAAPVQSPPPAPPKSIGKYFISDGKGNIIANASSDEVDKAIDAKYSLKPSDAPKPMATSVKIPPAAINYLQNNPDQRDAFEEKYGAGSSVDYLP